MLTTWGDTDDLRHFLPRLLELATSDDLNVDVEIVPAKLRMARWWTWPPDERAAVEAYLAAWWRQTLAAFPARHDVGTVLCAIAQVVDDLAPLLSTWLDEPSEAAARHLADLVNDVVRSITHRSGVPVYVGGPWWRERPDHLAQVVTWLAQPSLGQVLERAFFHAGSGTAAAELSTAVDQLAWISTLDLLKTKQLG